MQVSGYTETSKINFQDGNSPQFIDKNYYLIGFNLHIRITYQLLKKLHLL